MARPRTCGLDRLDYHTGRARRASRQSPIADRTILCVRGDRAPPRDGRVARTGVPAPPTHAAAVIGRASA